MGILRNVFIWLSINVYLAPALSQALGVAVKEAGGSVLRGAFPELTFEGGR